MLLDVIAIEVELRTKNTHTPLSDKCELSTISTLCLAPLIFVLGVLGCEGSGSP